MPCSRRVRRGVLACLHAVFVSPTFEDQSASPNREVVTQELGKTVTCLQYSTRVVRMPDPSSVSSEPASSAYCRARRPQKAGFRCEKAGSRRHDLSPGLPKQLNKDVCGADPRLRKPRWPYQTLEHSGLGSQIVTVELGRRRGQTPEHGITKLIRLCHGRSWYSTGCRHNTRLANAVGDIALPHPSWAPYPTLDAAP